jgi:asparagine synthase (glutamine-hydrolysing)
VRPNTVVDISATGGVRIHVGPLPEERELTLSTRELAGALRQEFEAAVARECAGARRVAVLSGGGVDSSNLLAIALHNARHHGTAEPIALAFDYGGEGDDRPHMRALCDHLGVEPLRVAPAEGAPYAGQDRVIDGTLQGTAPASSVFALMARAKAAGAELVLTGDGSETLLDAAPPVFGDFFMRDPLGALRCAWRFRSIYETRPQSWRRLVLGPLLRLVVPTVLVEQRRIHLDHRAGLLKSRARAWAGPRLKAFLIARRDYAPSRPIESQRARVMQLASSSLPMVLRESFSRWEIACGLPISFPYLDDDFAQFMARIPSNAIFAGARERGLLRESMEGLVPDSVRYRVDKARADRAFAELFCAMGGYDAVRDLVTMRELDRLGIVEAKSFRVAFERFAADPFADASAWGTLWPAISAESYVRWFNDFTGRSVPSATWSNSAVAPV